MSLKKCDLCGKRISSHLRIKYCPDCHKFIARMWVQGFSRPVIESILDYVRQNGFVDYYTRMELNMHDPNSPWYGVFDHWIPGDGRKVVLTSALINGMKSDLTEEEFWYYVEQLNNFFEHHSRIKKKPLVYWDRLYPIRLLRRGESLENWPTMTPILEGPTPRIKGKKCNLCGRPVFANHSIYCLRCHHFVQHVAHKRLPAATVNALFDYVRQYGFVDYYTHMKLNMSNRKSPWYLVIDHWIPHNNAKVVLTSSLINEMKLDLTEKEFRYFIKALANYKKKGIAIRKITLTYWNRLKRGEKLNDVLL